MSASAQCIFCKIIRGEMSAIKVYEDEHTLSFMDVQPASPGHTLVVAKTHAPNLLDIAEADLLVVTVSTQRIARAVQQALVPDGIRINQFNGAAAGQTVLHYHVHIMPIWEGRRVSAHEHAPTDLDELRALAARIRNAMRRVNATF